MNLAVTPANLTPLPGMVNRAAPVNASPAQPANPVEFEAIAYCLGHKKGPAVGWHELAALGLTVECFQSPDTLLTASEIHQGAASGQAINATDIQLKLLNTGHQGASNIAQAAISTGSLKSADEVARAITEQHGKAKALKLLQQLTHELETQPEFDLSDAVNELANIASNKQQKHIHNYADMVKAGFEYMSELADPSARGQVIYTGISALDDLLGGAQPGDLLVVAGRPSTGKTAAVVNFAEAAGLSDYIRQQRFGGDTDGIETLPIGIVSGEQPARQIGLRHIMVAQQLNTASIRTGEPSEQDIERAFSMTTELVKDPVAAPKIHLYDEHQPAIEDVVTVAHAWKAQHDIRALYVDYIQLLGTRQPFKPSEKLAKIELIATTLKKLAVTLKIPVIAMAQLSKDADRRAGGVPTANDLADSDIIFKSADSIVAIHNPSLYDTTVANDRVNLIALKNKHGPIGSVAAAWCPETITFSDIKRAPWSIRVEEQSESHFADSNYTE